MIPITLIIGIFAIVQTSSAEGFRISHDTCTMMVEKDQLDGDDELIQMLYEKGYKVHEYDYDKFEKHKFEDDVIGQMVRDLPLSGFFLDTEMEVDRSIFDAKKKQTYKYQVLEIDGRIDPVHLRDMESPNGSTVAYRGPNARVVARSKKTFTNHLFDFGTLWDGFEERAEITIRDLPNCRVF